MPRLGRLGRKAAREKYDGQRTGEREKSLKLHLLSLLLLLLFLLLLWLLLKDPGNVRVYYAYRTHEELLEILIRISYGRGEWLPRVSWLPFFLPLALFSLSPFLYAECVEGIVLACAKYVHLAEVEEITRLGRRKLMNNAVRLVSRASDFHPRLVGVREHVARSLQFGMCVMK